MAIYELGDIAPELPQDGDFWIAPGAHVVGRVRVGRGVGIWFGAILRGDNEWIEIGEGSNIQENAVLHTDPGYPLSIGAGCTIGHGAIVHGCTLGDNTLIGMGATVMNGAQIGRNCLVAAGAVVTERKEFPDNVLIMGAPAKVVRPIDAQGQDALRQSALTYQNNYRRFAANLKRLEDEGQ